jgi:hypothetical protein
LIVLGPRNDVEMITPPARELLDLLRTAGGSAEDKTAPTALRATGSHISASAHVQLDESRSGDRAHRRPTEAPMITATRATSIADRVAALPWHELLETLDTQGFAQTPPVLYPEECEQLSALYETGSFRSTITMARHRFGQGEYRYFAHPLPAPVADLRSGFYAPLSAAANRWAERLGDDTRYPEELGAFIERCRQAGQTRPTPLILRYGRGDWNALHQDIYGEVAFPFQAVTVLDRAGEDFQGGEFVLLEQRPRAQSRAHVVTLRRGAFLMFATRHRPVRGTRGYYRSAIRHGVSTVLEGQRTTFGIVFHDAR